jgi:hypothetical protein
MYFDSHYVSNSDLKRLRHLTDPKFQDPADLEEIFAFGKLVEDLILQPHKANYNHRDIGKAQEMERTFRDDPICRQLLHIHDLRRQHEFYRLDRYHVKARCKMDADSKLMGLVFELKGLSVTSDSAFEDSIDHFHYDQGLAWYLDVSGYRRALLVAVSKKKTDKLFKRIVDRDHVYYKRGVVKVKKAINLWHQYFGTNGQ